jgi:DNA topoisomerase VI subunit A
MIHDNIQDEKACSESAKISILHDNKMLLQQLDVARKDYEDLNKDHEELQVKSKADVKLLVKEVKSLRNSQRELKQELSRLMKEKLEVEVNSLFTKTCRFHHFASCITSSSQVFNVYPTS